MAVIIATQSITVNSGNGTSVSNSSRKAVWIEAFGTFAGGTVKAQYSPDNGTTFIDITSASGSANWYILTYVPQGYLIRSNITGATSPTVTFNVIEAIRD